LPVGYEYFSINPNVPQGSLPLLGGEYNRSTYSDLWEWVQQQTGYLKTEAEWQALSTANNGNVPYYSSGDGSTTFRVPSLRCWVKGTDGSAQLVGSYLAAGLPNVTGNLLGATTYSVATDGALGWEETDPTNYSMNYQSGGMRYGRIKFDASNSDSIYGNSSTVQPESIVGLWLVKAYGTIVDTGTIDEQQYIDDRIAALPNTFLPLAGGTMSGAIHFNGANNRSFGFDLTNNNANMDIGWNFANRDGAGIGLRSTDDTSSTAGSFSIYARDGSNFTDLKGLPDGRLTWGDKEIERVNSSGSNYIRYESGIQIVFGRIEVSGASSYVKTYTYPVAFKNYLDIYIAMGGRWTANNEQASIQNDTDTKFEVSITNAGSNPHNWYFIAVGYWK